REDRARRNPDAARPCRTGGTPPFAAQDARLSSDNSGRMLGSRPVSTGQAPKTILCLASYFKGNAFLEQCKREGWRVVLLTSEPLLKKPWAREHIDEVFAVPVLTDRKVVRDVVSYLARTRQFDRIAPLDDYDVEMVAYLREHLRIPGMGETTARYFRDKL